jgi:hypothetical protein
VGETARRIAENDHVFREANEQIAPVAREGELELVPFICECADESCTQIVRLSLDEYERVRVDSRHFLNVPGHEVNAGRYGQVVDSTGRFVVVEKLGEAGEIVRELDRRDGGIRDA